MAANLCETRGRNFIAQVVRCRIAGRKEAGTSAKPLRLVQFHRCLIPGKTDSWPFRRLRQ